MEIMKSPLIFSKKSAITIGLFDGVHLGHRKLIEHLFEYSAKRHLTPVVYTFTNHPVKENKRKFITTLEERLYLLEKIGVEYVYLTNLDKNFMQMLPEEFVKRELVERLNTHLVIVGKNFRFGFKKSGDISTLMELGNYFNFDVIAEDEINLKGKSISSSLIHDLIKEGLVESANEFLGHTYFMQGIINKGKGVGRHLGFPTANLTYENGNKLLPKNGVYITIGNYNGMLLKGVTNVGFNPTFEDKKRIKIESHFLDVNYNFYGKFLRLYFIKRLRDEIKFEKVQDLRNQVMIDIEEARNFFSKNPVEKIPLI